jgi:hypothetical protein
MRPTFAGDKHSAAEVTPALTRANPSIASLLPLIAYLIGAVQQLTSRVEASER